MTAKAKSKPLGIKQAKQYKIVKTVQGVELYTLHITEITVTRRCDPSPVADEQPAPASGNITTIGDMMARWEQFDEKEVGIAAEKLGIRILP